ncbi:MAG: ATP-binding protein, partial [Nakamurella sp.]
VPVDERDRIFDRFVRLSRERTGTGTGLGLPIARAIVRREGGDVVCIPKTHGSGGWFELHLPAANGGGTMREVPLAVHRIARAQPHHDAGV